MMRFIPVLAVVALSLAPAAALADLYVNAGRSLSGGPTMVRDPRADMPKECHRYSEDSTVCSTYEVGQIGKLHFVTVHDLSKYCDIWVGVEKKGADPHWLAHVGQSNGPSCFLTWINENTVMVRAR